MNRIGAAVAIATLLFTGIATYFQAEVAQGQLDESRHQSSQKQRAQAVEVTYWADHAPLKLSFKDVHVMNRSPDPVTDAFLILGMVGEKVGNRTLTIVVPMTSIAPCSEVTYDPKQLQDPDSKKPFRLAGQPTYIEALTFRDASGLDWVRQRGKLTQTEETWSDGIYLTMPETVSRVDVCGTDSL